MSGDMESTNLSLIPSKALSYSSRHMLARFLNPEQSLPTRDGLLRDYRGLAGQMGFEYIDIRNFEIKKNPTMDILEEWAIHPDATIGKLIQFLENIERHDIIQDMQDKFEIDAKTYLLKKSQPLNINHVQVHEVTSQIPTAYPLNFLTCHDANTGDITFYDAYLSYADEDIYFVKILYEKLSQEGFNLFFRSKDFLAGHSEYDITMQLIKERCKHVLVILSPNFLMCPACEVQASFAAGLGYEERKRIIIPVLLKKCEIPLVLKILSKIDFTKPDIEGWTWRRLISSLQDHSSPDFIPFEKRLSQSLPYSVPQIKSCPETPNAAITFPPSITQTIKTKVSSNELASSLEISQEENDSFVTNSKSTSPVESKSRFRSIFSKKKVNKKSANFSYSVTSVSSSNATSGFHSQSIVESVCVQNANDTVGKQ